MVDWDNKMFSEFYVEIERVHPSQLYINEKKRLRIMEWIKPESHNYHPIPVKKYGEKLYLTDGHTRAVCIREAGCTHMKVVWDQDDLDDSEYLTCIEWCLREEILSIDDLKNRIVSDGDYQRLWIQRCEKAFGVEG